MKTFGNIVLVLVVAIGFLWALNEAFRKEDKIEAAHERAMAKLVRDQKGFDLNPDGTIANTLHNQHLMGKK